MDDCLPPVRHVSEERRTYFVQLAERVRTALLDAGLSAVVITGDEFAPGANITVDTVDDGGAGVYVSWRTAPGLTTAAHRSLLSGELDHPSLVLSGKIRSAMRVAICSILQAAGMEARFGSDDMDPLRTYIT